MGVCRQDPCAGSHRWIEVTGATISGRCCSYGTHSALQTLVLHREEKLYESNYTANSEVQETRE